MPPPSSNCGEEIREPLIQIVEPAAENRIVTAIEVLSPDNKSNGGKIAYLQKREEFWAVERTWWRSTCSARAIRPYESPRRKSRGFGRGIIWWRSLAFGPRGRKFIPSRFPRRLPHSAISLAENDKDVTLDLQAAFARCWDEGPYPELLRYDGPPAGNDGWG